MGSFASTCAVSGIPLEVGDPVRWYSLTENPYDDNLVCYSHDMWFPRSWPVRAKYNDYGSIEEYDASSPSVFATVECLKRDLVEVGMGDNSCHDVPTAKGMSFEATLEAIWEKRIQVSRDTEDPVLAKIRASTKAAREALKLSSEEEEPRPRAIPGFPTLRGVEAVLRQAGFPVLTAEGKEPEAYMVDEIEYGRCRVRVHGYGEHTEQLQAILPILQHEYAAVVTVGSRAYANSAEIQLMPKVMKRERDEYFSWGRDDTERRKPLYVYQGMIHGDVWDELMKMKVSKDWAEKVKVGFDESRADAQKLWDKACKARKKSHNPIDDLIARLDNDHDTYVGALVAKGVIPFTVGLSDHWNAVVDRHRDEKFTTKQVDEFLDDVAGFSLLHGILPMVRYWWRPSFTCGPQFGEHKKHADVFAAFRRATMAAKKRRKW
jgi:hypothetical protein